ncbi:hypothetical protein RSOLAG22IIIB_08206 [Rhizoctonia solani]|uniref:Uncharacterized protein n=1 Tax=Rhizoctonia solani TaxID=456999 RepID=A0A0K6FSA4_9AGAM|nr:hypothetical protein RSOLAG22IIIB_08206 [Rhizoctonia solani]
MIPAYAFAAIIIGTFALLVFLFVIFDTTGKKGSSKSEIAKNVPGDEAKDLGSLPSHVETTSEVQRAH